MNLFPQDFLDITQRNNPGRRHEKRWKKIAVNSSPRKNSYKKSSFKKPQNANDKVDSSSRELSTLNSSATSPGPSSMLLVLNSFSNALDQEKNLFFSILDKFQQIQEASVNFALEKELFCDKYNSVEIESQRVMESVRRMAKNWMKELDEVYERCVGEWDRQLRICLEGKLWLESVKSVEGEENLLENFYSKFSRQIGVVNALSLDFQPEGVQWLKELMSLSPDKEKMSKPLESNFLLKNQKSVKNKKKTMGGLKMITGKDEFSTKL